MNWHCCIKPKVDLADGRVVGLEALIRWLPRSGNIIGPDQFIPVAEETGLIVPIGRWVVRAACIQWIAWRDAGLNPPPVVGNLSPRQLSDAKRGLHVYIDDFGMGYSNLGHLKRMPVDALKIDKSFVNDVLTDSDDAEIANAIIRLAHALKLRVVAEGVETLEQVAFLKQNGCDEIQGYVVSKPLPSGKVSQLFALDYTF